MKLIYLKSALKCDSFDVAIDIKIQFFRVLVTIEPDRSLLQFVTTNCLKKTLQQLLLFVSKVPEVIEINELQMKDRIVKLCHLMHSLFQVQINIKEVWNLANNSQ